MRFFECPYCKRIVTSILSLGNAAYILNTNKKCPHCFGRIRINLKSYMLSLLVVILSFVIVIVLTHTFINNIGILLLLFIFSYIVSIVQITIYSKYLKFRLFLPKDNVEEHMKNLPSYLK